MADALASGASGKPCRFKSCHLHQKINPKQHTCSDFLLQIQVNYGILSQKGETYMNFVTIHGLGFDFTQEGTFGPYVISKLKQFGDVYNCKFPLGDQLIYSVWEKTLELAINNNDVKLDQDTIVVAHSLGTMFLPKFITRHNIKLKGFIAIAGGYYPGYKGPTDDFMPTAEEMKYAKNNIKEKHFVYSDNDRYFIKETQQNYITSIDAIPHFIPGKGHFGRTEKITEIPEIEQIVKEMTDLTGGEHGYKTNSTK